MNSIYAVGLMTGTSLDGVDVSMMQTDGESIQRWVGDLFVPFTTEFRQKLHKHLGKKNPPEFLIHEYTQINIAAVQALETQLNIKANVIGFHGQTLWHQPRAGHQKAETYQMADAPLMADVLQRCVVYNFRQNDIDHGGEGAPLIPIYHRALLGNANHAAVVNIGGVANITIIHNGDLIAGDVGPGCALINDCMQTCFNEPFDENGHRAEQGTVQDTLLDEWLSDPFFNQLLPKSLDRDRFKSCGLALKNLKPEDQLATLTAFTARAISHHAFLDINLVYLCGGGRLNQYLIRVLNSLGRVVYKPIESLGFKGDFIESQGFAYMAVRRLYDLPISFPTTTGVSKPVTGGEIVGEINFRS